MYSGIKLHKINKFVRMQRFARLCQISVTEKRAVPYRECLRNRYVAESCNGSRKLVHDDDSCDSISDVTQDAARYRLLGATTSHRWQTFQTLEINHNLRELFITVYKIKDLQSLSALKGLPVCIMYEPSHHMTLLAL